MKEASRSSNTSSLARKVTLLALSAATLSVMSTEIEACGVAAIKVNPLGQSHANVLDLQAFA